MADHCPYCGEEMDTPGHGIYPDRLLMREAIICPNIPEDQVFILGGDPRVTRKPVALRGEG